MCSALASGAGETSAAPDLEGTWTNASLTRLERPSEYGSRAVLTSEAVSETFDIEVQVAHNAGRWAAMVVRS